MYYHVIFILKKILKIHKMLCIKLKYNIKYLIFIKVCLYM